MGWLLDLFLRQQVACAGTGSSQSSIDHQPNPKSHQQLGSLEQLAIQAWSIQAWSIQKPSPQVQSRCEERDQTLSLSLDTRRSMVECIRKRTSRRALRHCSISPVDLAECTDSSLDPQTPLRHRSNAKQSTRRWLLPRILMQLHYRWSLHRQLLRTPPIAKPPVPTKLPKRPRSSLV